MTDNQLENLIERAWEERDSINTNLSNFTKNNSKIIGSSWIQKLDHFLVKFNDNNDNSVSILSKGSCD